MGCEVIAIKVSPSAGWCQAGRRSGFDVAFGIARVKRCEGRIEKRKENRSPDGLTFYRESCSKKVKFMNTHSPPLCFQRTHKDYGAWAKAEEMRGNLYRHGRIKECRKRRSKKCYENGKIAVLEYTAGEINCTAACFEKCIALVVFS